MNGARTLYTIGYQGARLADFIAALQGAGVRMLVDVRFHPFSRRPEFRRGALKEAIEAAGIGYTHLRQLGNPPPSRDAARAGDVETYHRLFQAHLDRAETVAALRQVIALDRAGPVALMCLERDPGDCHRLMVAERAAAMSELRVAHLNPAGPPKDEEPLLL